MTAIACRDTRSQFFISKAACSAVKRVGYREATVNDSFCSTSRLQGSGGVVTNSPTVTSLSKISAQKCDCFSCSISFGNVIVSVYLLSMCSERLQHNEL